MKFKPGKDDRRYTGGRKPGAKNHRTLIREALEKKYKDGELGFWKAVVSQAKKGDSQAMGILANRLVPTLKSEHSIVDIKLPKGDAVKISSYLIESAARGEISLEQLNVMISSISTALKIEESIELEARVMALETR